MCSIINALYNIHIEQAKRRKEIGSMENKVDILKAFEETLKLTREFSDLDALKYTEREDGTELVLVYFGSNLYPTYKVNVTADSGIAMISDILRKIR